MKRLPLDRLSGQVLGARTTRSLSSRLGTSSSCPSLITTAQRRQVSGAAASPQEQADHTNAFIPRRPPGASRIVNPREREDSSAYPSPLPEKALSSAKLAALHARLALSRRLPLQTLARTLVDPSADMHPHFNNASLALLGQTLINYHVSEWIMCRFPRLPMLIFYEALRAYSGDKPLYQVARSWGIESAASPGGEVDPGLLQFNVRAGPKSAESSSSLGYSRVEAAYLDKFKWRRGISSRVVLDDDFGDAVHKKATDEAAESARLAQLATTSLGETYGDESTRARAEAAHANLVRAVVGALYTHCGRDAAKAFVKSHLLSRRLDFAKLFSFRTPTKELATLCAREDFEEPVARLLSETGRHSRTPVFVVGIYSGHDKLGEGASYSLDSARTKASMNALLAWYLYSPGEIPRVPSDMLEEGAKPWQPVHIDMGEVVTK